MIHQDQSTFFIPSQQFLLPLRLDSFVPEDHIARIIREKAPDGVKARGGGGVGGIENGGQQHQSHTIIQLTHRIKKSKGC